MINNEEYEIEYTKSPASVLAMILGCLYIFANKLLLPLGFGTARISTLILLAFFGMSLVANFGDMRIDRFFWIEIAFVVLTTLISAAICTNITFVSNSFLSLTYGCIFGIGMLKTAQKVGNIRWFFYTWYSVGMVYTGYILITGGALVGKMGRLSATESLNSNTLGVMLLFGIFCAFFLVSDYARYGSGYGIIFRMLIMIISVAMMFYIILGTASRKSTVLAIFIIVTWFLFCFKSVIKKCPPAGTLAILTATFILIAIILYFYGDRFIAISDTLQRRMEASEDDSLTNNIRVKLIIDALKVFGKNFFFGVGWNNYRFVSAFRLYSHCTYVEVLACTGLVGATFMIIFVSKLIKSFIAFLRLDSVEREIKTLMVIFAIMFGILNFVQIMFYNTTLLMMFHMLLVYLLVENEKADDICQANENVEVAENEIE